MERKSTSDSRSVEDISDKRLRIEVQSAQTNGVERVKRFVNIRLHCIVIRQQPEKDKQNFDVAPTGKTSVDAHGYIEFDVHLWS